MSLYQESLRRDLHDGNLAAHANGRELDRQFLQRGRDHPPALRIERLLDHIAKQLGYAAAYKAELVSLHLHSASEFLELRRSFQSRLGAGMHRDNLGGHFRAGSDHQIIAELEQRWLKWKRQGSHLRQLMHSHPGHIHRLHLQAQLADGFLDFRQDIIIPNLERQDQSGLGKFDILPIHSRRHNRTAIHSRRKGGQ